MAQKEVTQNKLTFRNNSNFKDYDIFFKFLFSKSTQSGIFSMLLA